MNTVKKSNKYAIVCRDDRYRTVLNEQATRERNLYGATIILTDLTVSRATEWQEAFNRQTANNLSDVFVRHCNPAPQEEISEFDIITAHCSDGIYRTGSVVTWNAKFVLIEVGNKVYRATVKSAELIAKVDDMDYDLTDEYDAWLNEIEETYAIQTQTEMVA
jgi:hypothetical protein